MANKTFRRVLSIIMCAAMLVSVFAVSFTASADIKTDTTNGTKTYDWNFTKAETADADLAEMTDNSVFYNPDSTKFTMGNGYLSMGVDKGSNFETAVFEKPEGYELSKLSVTVPYGCYVSDYASQVGVVIGIAGYDNSNRILQLSMADKSYSNSNGSLNITNRNANWDNDAVHTSIGKLKLKTPDGTGDATGNYGKAFGINNNKELSDFTNFTYTYDVTVNNDNSVTVIVTVTYTPDEDTTYTTIAEPITIDLATLQNYKNGSSIKSFTPAFGVGKYNENTTQNNMRAGKLHKVTAVYKKSCEHTSTTIIPGTAPTCTEDGKKDEEVCALCDAHISGGEVIPATGHKFGSWTVTVEPTENTTGLRVRTCKVCSETESEELSPLDGSTIYNWNYADENDGEAAYTETMQNLEFVTSNAKNFTYNTDSNYLEIATGYNTVYYQTAVIKTPKDEDGNDKVPSKFYVTSPNDSSKQSQNGVPTAMAGAVLGYITINDKASPLYAYAISGNYFTGADVVLRFSADGYGDKTKYFTKTLNLKKTDGSYSGSNKYKSVFEDDIAAADLKNLTYTYDVTVNDNNDGVTLVLKIEYVDSSGEKHNTESEPITINLEYLKNQKEDKNNTNLYESATDFTPAFGIVRAYNGGFNVVPTSKVYKVWAKYAAESSTVEPEITASATVALDDGIKLKITAEGNEGIKAGSFKLSVDGEEQELPDEGVTITKFAHQMADKMEIKITAEGVNGDTVTKEIGDGSGYSIADNLANAYEQLTDEKDAATKKLIAKLANYGAAAQKYDELANGTKYTQYANYFLNDTEKETDAAAYNTMDSVLDGTFVKKDSDVFATGLKASLAIGLQENIKMIIRVSGINLRDDQQLYVRMDGMDDDVLLTEVNGVYTGQFGTFKPKEYADSKTITLVVKSNDTETSAEAEVSGEVTYSVGTYINRMASKKTTSDGLRLLLNAIAEYSNAYADVYAQTNA